MKKEERMISEAPDEVNAENGTQENSEKAVVAHAEANEVKMVTEAELQSEIKGEGEGSDAKVENLVARGEPTGEVSVMVPAGGNDEYVTRAELESLIEEAYMRGLNEAVTKQIIADTSVGNALGEMTDDLASLFAGRPSVWE